MTTEKPDLEDINTTLNRLEELLKEAQALALATDEQNRRILAKLDAANQELFALYRGRRKRD